MQKKHIQISEIYSQKEYDDTFKTVHPKELFKANGPKIQPLEASLILKYQPKTVVDIGSSNGARLFPFFRKQKIQCTGVEKFDLLIKSANRKWKKNIKKVDISVPHIKLAELALKEPVDMVTMLGLSFGGVHIQQHRENAFANIAEFLKPGGVLIMDTLSYAGFSSHKNGRFLKVREYFPNQYAPSRRELTDLARDNNLIHIQINKVIQDDTLIAYLVFKKK